MKERSCWGEVWGKFLKGNGRSCFKIVCSMILLLCFFQVSFVEAAVWTRVNTDGFGMVPPGEAGSALTMAVYNNRLYAGTVNYENGNGCQVWRYNGGTSWTQVSSSGLGDSQNFAIFAMAVSNGLLYVGTFNNATGAEVWSYDGSTWNQVNTDGFGAGTANPAVGALIVFNDQLYAGVGNTNAGVARVFRYDGGTNWTQVNTDGFGIANTKICRSFAIHNGQLYAGSFNQILGGGVFRYDGGMSWTQVNTDGFGTSDDETRVLQSYNGVLYAGTSGTNYPKIWRYDGGTSWTDISPTYPDNANDSIRSMTVFNGTLYVGTGNYNGVGTQIYSFNGSTWNQVNTNGFGDPLNQATHSLIVFNNQLYAGVFAVDWGSPTVYYGARVWVLGQSTTSVPGLSLWGMLVLVALLAISAVVIMRGRVKSKYI